MGWGSISLSLLVDQAERTTLFDKLIENHGPFPHFDATLPHFMGVDFSVFLCTDATLPHFVGAKRGVCLPKTRWVGGNPWPPGEVRRGTASSKLSSSKLQAA